MLSAIHLRRQGTAVLAVWMTVLGLGVSICHAHAAGSIPHVHGYGWNQSTCLSSPAGHSEGPLEPHRHFVLLGIEFPGDECPDCAVASSGTPHASSAVSSGGDLPECQTADIFLGHTPAMVFVGLVTPSRTSSTPPVPAAPLSAFARRDVSGVLRS